jgi:hypothetical protein
VRNIVDPGDEKMVEKFGPRERKYRKMLET